MDDNSSEDHLHQQCTPLDLRDFAVGARDQELADLAKAIAHPARLQIIRLLGQRTNCVCGEIVDELPLAQSTVSEHLRVLKEAGLIRGELDGPRVCYCLDPLLLERLKMLVQKL